MPTKPATNTGIAVQNDTTGQSTYLQFQGSTLIQSATRNYAGPGWNVVTQGGFGGGAALVVQNQTTGLLDFLALDFNGNLVGSAMSNTSVRL